jgi:DNA-binding NarL/FixJ family response regulator
VQARVKVLIVDDHAAFAEALGLTLALEDGFEVLPHVATVTAALDAVARERPDVVVMDVQLPDGDGADAAARVLAAAPATRVVILSGFLDVDVLTAAAAAGVSAFVLKEESVQRVIDVIRPAADGTITINPATLQGLLTKLADRTAVATGGAPTRLTAREAEVLSLLGQGVDAQSIARQLGITVNTGRSHLKSIMAKLGAHSQLEAVALASQAGLISR